LDNIKTLGNLLKDSDLNAAVFGLIGVVIGGILTILSQALARRNERLHQLKEDVADTIALAHMIRSSLNSIHVDQRHDSEARKVYGRALTNDIPEFYKKCQSLAIVGTLSVRHAALNLAKDAGALIDYAHPGTGTGRDHGFTELDAKAYPVERSEDTLAGVVRSYWWLRWVYLLWRRSSSKREEVAAGKL